MRTSTVWVAAPAGALVVLAGCADPEADAGAGVGPDEQLYETVATVLEAPDTGPQLCHAVNDSLPPQCDGPEVVGWDWDEVESESAGGTTWGQYRLVGAWDGERFQLAAPAEPAGAQEAAEFAQPAGPRFETPCPEPADGWRPTDPDTATQSALRRATELAAEAPGYAGSWVDRSPDGDLEHRDTPGPEDLSGSDADPATVVLNVRFTGELDERERELRDVWGGPLCVTDAVYTESELRDIQQRLHADRPDLTSSGVDVVANAVVAQVFVATSQEQAELDTRYGPGAVQLRSLLRPR